MRALRLSLAGMVILVLVGGLGSVVVAQEDEDATPVSATYVSGLGAWTGRGVHGEIYYAVDMRDPRVDGVLITSSFEGDEYLGVPIFPAPAALSNLQLENDGGTWDGIGWAVYHPRMGWHLSGWLAGRGPYEGLTLYLHAARGAHSYPEMSYEGVIFEGPAPGVLVAVAPSAE